MSGRRLNTRLLSRLAITAAAAILLILALAYWWQGNLFHEIVGTAMFALLIGHNLINRWWYGTILRTPPDRRRRILLIVNLTLAVPMLALLVTSILVSQSLFAFLPIGTAVSIREMHVLAAYWVLALFAIHLGVHWPIVMRAVSDALGYTGASPLRTLLLRVVAGGIALYGAYCVSLMGLGNKLANQYTMDMWDFEQRGVEFLLNHAAIAGLFSVLAHYGANAMLRRAPAKRRA